jgi:hypothetical protein
MKYSKYMLYEPNKFNLDADGYERLKPKEHEARLNSAELRSKYKRNSWITIQSDKNKIYRIVKGTAASGLTNELIWLDYDSKLELAGSTKSLESVKVRKSNFLEVYFLALWNQPNRIERAQFKLTSFIALLSIILAIYAIYCGC